MEKAFQFCIVFFSVKLRAYQKCSFWPTLPFSPVPGVDMSHGFCISKSIYQNKYLHFLGNI